MEFKMIIYQPGESFICTSSHVAVSKINNWKICFVGFQTTEPVLHITVYIFISINSDFTFHEYFTKFLILIPYFYLQYFQQKLCEIYLFDYQNNM